MIDLADSNLLKIGNVISKHDDTWFKLENENSAISLQSEKKTKFYLSEDIYFTKNHYRPRWYDNERITLCMHGHKVIFYSDVDFAQVDKFVEFVDCGGDEEEAMHNEEWSPANQEGLYEDTAISHKFKKGKFYLTEDIVLSGKFEQPQTGKNELTICLHGQKVTIDETFSMYSVESKITFTNCQKEKADLEILGNISKIKIDNEEICFENLNIISDQKLELVNKYVFDNCDLNVNSTEDVAIEVKDTNVEFKNLEYNDQDSGFLIDKSTVTFENVNMKNNTVQTLFTVQNNSTINVKGTGVYEGNKNIYDLYDSKLNVIDGSGKAKDILRDPASAEYYDAVVTKKHTKLLNPDTANINIVYKRNVGAHIIRSFNSETVFDGVIVQNDFVGAEATIGSYIAAGQQKSKLTLINRAYVNQNRRNILVNDNSDIYGSITYKDGTFDTLDRDATLSFYPIHPEMVIMKDVIKKDENSLILTPRNLKTDDEWNTLIGDYIYKACMIDGYTNDLYEYENTDPETHPSAKSWVICDVEDREDGLQQGTFKIGKKDLKIVTIRLHLGEGTYYGSTFQDNEMNIPPREDFDGDTIELYWRPFYRARNYQETFAESFENMLIKWVDYTVPGEPYEYQLVNWSFYPERLVTNRTRNTVTGHTKETLSEFIKDELIFNKWEKYHYKDEIDLYACWKGNLKLKLVYDVDPKMRDESFPIPIDYFERKEVWAREQHPTTLPVYTDPKDFMYEGFDLTGWREIYFDQTQQTSDYSVEFKSELYEMGQEYTPGDHTEKLDGGTLLFNPDFRGSDYKIYWCLNTDYIKSVNNNLIQLDQDGYYVQDTKLGEPYSILKPEINDSITSIKLTCFELQDDLEFLGWTKQQITEPVDEEGLNDLVLVRDYVKGYASREDSYYYPVLLRSALGSQHSGYDVLTPGKINMDGALDAGIYHLNSDLSVMSAKEIGGNVTIDLHGKKLTFEPGAFFYSAYDVIFTDCKYDDLDTSTRGRIYNANGVIYEGTGTLKFNKVTLAGKQAYTFQDLDKEVIMDDVDILQANWVGIMHDPDKEDQYPRNMQIENSSVHIKNSTIHDLTGMFYVMDGSHLTMTNIVMKNCGGPGAEWNNGGTFRVLYNSKLTINSPAWFQNNKDLFYVVDSNLELNSNVDHYDGDLEAVKDEAIIFTENGIHALGYLTSADVKASGIFVNNPIRIGIFSEFAGLFESESKRGNQLHYDGYIYVRGNAKDAGHGGDIFIHGNEIKYYQNDSDRINPNSVLDIYTYFNDPHYFTNCDQDVCRDVFIIGNLSNEEKEAFDRNRDSDGKIRNFTFVNKNMGYTSGEYYPIIDGVHYDNEKNRGWDIVYNKRREQNVIDICFKMAPDTLGRFYDMEGKVVKETIVQLDKNEPDEFNAWFNNFEANYIAADSSGYKVKRKLGKFYRRTLNPRKKTDQLLAELEYDMYKSADYLTIIITEERTDEVTENNNTYEYPEYDVLYYPYPRNMDIVQSEGATYMFTIDGQDWSWNDKAKGISRNDSHTIRTPGLKQTYSKIVGGDYDRYTDMFPYEFKGWALRGYDNVVLQPGMKVNFATEFGSSRYYYLDAIWEPRKMQINFMTNDYVKYRHSEDGSYSVIATIGETIKVPKALDLEIDPTMTFFGWVTEEDHTRFTINGVKLPQDMYISKFAQEKLTLRLGSTYKVKKYLRYFNIYPLFFPKNDTILNNIIQSHQRKTNLMIERLKLIGSNEPTVNNLHVDHEVQKADFFAAESDMTKSICLYEDTNFTGTVNVDGDLRLCLHKKNFTIDGGKFNILNKSKLTICNCENEGTVTIKNSDFVNEKGTVVFEKVKVDTKTVLNFDDQIIGFVLVDFSDINLQTFVHASNNSEIDFVNCTFNNINISGNYFVTADTEAKVNFERMEFDGLKKAFSYDSAQGLFNGVSIKNSTADVLFTVKNDAKVNIKQYVSNTGYVHSYFENNKNIALVDNAKFMVSGANSLDSQNDIVLTDDYGNPTRDSYNGTRTVEKQNIKLLDSAENPIDESKLQRVVFRNNNGNYLFGAQNNAQIFFNGIALKNTFTAKNGKMGVYVNLGGQNTLVLRSNPYINQNNRNIVVTSDDYITSDTNEAEFATIGQPLSSDATLSFYLTEHKYQRVLVGANDASVAQLKGTDFEKMNYSVQFEDGSVRKNYFFASCMIEGHRDDIFTQYGDNYAGNNMRIVYGQGQDGSGDFGFFAEPYEEKETISIKLNANGGKFKDPSGNDVTTSYTFTFKRSDPDSHISRWFDALAPTAVDSRDEYVGIFKGWSRLKDSLKSMTKYEILEYEADLELFAYFEYPDLVTLNFYAEKNNNNKLQNKAYDSFEPITKYVRLINNNLSGTVVAPEINITSKNGYLVSDKWETDDTSFNKYLEPGVSTAFQKVSTDVEYNYYLVWTEPEVNIKINSNNGKFSDPTGKVVDENSSYTFTYKRFTAADSLINWIKQLAPKAVDTVDNYEVSAKKFVDVNDSTKVYTAEQLLNVTSDTEVSPVYEFPERFTVRFVAEKNDESNLDGIAYDGFTDSIRYFRADQDNNQKGYITAPMIDVKTINGYVVSSYWITDDGSKLTPGNKTKISKLTNTDTITYYLVWSEKPIEYKAVFRAEKGGASSLRGKAYNSFTPITKYVSLNEDNNTKGTLTAPSANVITLKGKYVSDFVWRAENSAYGNVYAGGTLTVKEMNIPNDTMYFYLEYTLAASSGGGGGGGGGGGSSGVSLNDANLQAAQVQAPSQPQEPAEVPSNSNPFGIEVVTNALGQVQQLTAAEVGLTQMTKANAVMQAALANPNAPSARVSEVSIKASEAKWEKTAQGGWSLSTANSEPVKDAWQKVEMPNGKESWYKFDQNGNMQTGWVSDGKKVFFLIESGVNQGQMVCGATVNIGGIEFKFAADGALETMGAKS